MRNMSFMLTTSQIRERSKTVTRRVGWWHLRPGHLIQAVEKGMGLKKGETIKKLAVLRIVSVRREQLVQMPPDDLAKEGFPNMGWAEFQRMFCASHKGCTPETFVNRIEFEYVT